MNANEEYGADAYAALDMFLERFDALVETDPISALKWVDAAEDVVRDQSEWVLCRADAVRAALGAEEARLYLLKVLEEAPEFADGHNALAEIERALGNTEAAIQQELETLRLDSAVDLVACATSAELSEAIAAEAAKAVAELPAKMKERLGNVPIFLLPRPSEQLVSEGLEARCLGLFEGTSFAGTTPSETHTGPAITIFTHCLADAFGHDQEETLRQVRLTVLHEVGHYFCLEEEDLAELGLD